MKKALVTGITGQDGSYLAELLTGKGYEVHGIVRQSSSFNSQRIDSLLKDRHKAGGVNLTLHYGDLTDTSAVNRLVEKVQPDEIYNLAAQSHVAISFQQPEYTSEVNAMGTLRLLDALKDFRANTRFYQASTSELFGKAQQVPQSETTPFYPRSPYAVSKLHAFWFVKNYREAYNLFACNGILFNHESPRRGKKFVTRKITNAVALIRHGFEEALYLGNLDAKRDWGYAPDYVDAMYRMLQLDRPDDFVIATGHTHTVREFAERAFAAGGFTLVWKGAGVEETGLDRATGKTLVRIDPLYFRPSEVDLLIGDASKARAALGWAPKVEFEELVRLMVEADLDIVAKHGRQGLHYLT